MAQENNNIIMPRSPEDEELEGVRSKVDQALQGVKAVKGGVFPRGFELEGFDDAEGKKLRITPENVDMVDDMLKAEYGPVLPDLFEDKGQPTDLT